MSNTQILYKYINIQKIDESLENHRKVHKDPENPTNMWVGWDFVQKLRFFPTLV